MQPAGTWNSGNRGARARRPGAWGQGLLSILLPLFLLFEGLPCTALFGPCCPCSSEAVHSSRALAPASCCEGSTGAKLTPILVTEPQRSVGTTFLSTGNRGLPPIPGLPELPHLSPVAVALHVPPLLFLLLCNLRN